MSAYVNLGMIDPAAMARDAARANAAKFLDEFVGFRESCYLWCLRHPRGHLDAALAVPAWARGQLDGDGGRPAAPSVDELERGASGDALWDDAQRSLVASGELHNNVRMAWGKAVPAWHRAALPPPPAAGAPEAPSSATRLQAALALLVRLNDTFALDGGAPPSYGGLLWCLGWRDRPGAHGRPKPRPTSVLARRIRAGDLVELARRRIAAAGAELDGEGTAREPGQPPAKRPRQQACILDWARSVSTSA